MYVNKCFGFLFKTNNDEDNTLLTGIDEHKCALLLTNNKSARFF